MPTNVSGNPIGVASPAPLPDPDSVVIVAEPISGEGCTAASVNQEFTALANEQAWEKRPTGGSPAVPAGLDAKYAQPIKAYRNKVGNRRDMLDHRGFSSMGKVKRWQENWDNVGLVAKTGAGSGAWAGRWNYGLHVGSGAPTVFPYFGQWPAGIGTPPYGSGQLVLDSGGGGGSPTLEIVEANPFSGWQITEDSDMAFQIDLPGGGAGGGGAEVVYGLVADSQLTATAQFASGTARGAALIWSTTGTQFQLYTCAPGGSPVLTNTGITTATRMRIDIVGANAADDGLARVILFIDGAPVANVATDFAPVNPSDRVPYFPCIRQFNTGSRAITFVGTADFAAARFAGDVAY